MWDCRTLVFFFPTDATAIAFPYLPRPCTDAPQTHTAMAEHSNRPQYHTVTPYLIVPRLAELLDFLKSALDAEEIERMDRGDGTIMHAEVRIGDSIVMFGGSSDQYPPIPGCLYLMISDADAYYRRAIEAGATSLSEPKDEFYGHRVAAVTDLSGNQWWFATVLEELTSEELQRRAAALRG